MPKKATKTLSSEADSAAKQKVSQKATKNTKKAVVKKTKTTKKKATKQEPTLETVPQVVDNAQEPAKGKRPAPVICTFARERVLTEQTNIAAELTRQTAFGTLLDDGKVQLSLTEALYLMGKKRIVIYDGKNKLIDFDTFVRKASRVEPNFWTRYAVYKDMRDRGYIVKTALKFGADFRVYDRGIKPGEDHARWIVYPVHEGERYTWFDFAAKNRVAHSTKKRLLMGVVDDENDVTYWEIKWVRP